MPTLPLPLKYGEVTELVRYLRRQPHDPARVERILRDKLGLNLDLQRHLNLNLPLHPNPAFHVDLNPRRNVHLNLNLNPAPASRPLCALPLITALRAAAARPKADPRLRKALGVWRIVPAGIWQLHQTTNFAIHYTNEAGPNQVPAGVVTVAEEVFTLTDALDASYPTRLVGTLDPNLPAPRYVQELGFFFEDALGVYRSLGFDVPATPVQVYVADCPGGFGYTDPADSVILIGPTNYAGGGSLGQLTSHELFHLVQYRYYVPPPATLHPVYWYEGSANAAISLVNPNFTLWSGYQSCTPLESGYPYATVILWRYLLEQLTKNPDPVDSPMFGADVLRRCWEFARQQQAVDTATLAAAVNALTPGGVTFADFVFGKNGELLSNETVWGNFLAAWYLKDLHPPIPDRRFCYRPIPRFMMESALVTAGAVGAVVTASLQPWDVSYQEINLSGAAQPLGVGISAAPAAGAGDPQVLVQILVLSDTGALLDIIRTTSANYQRTIGSPYGSGKQPAAVGKVVLILATRAVAANFTGSVQAAAPAPDLMITRRDSPAGCEYQADWHDTARQMNTPDIWLVSTKTAKSLAPRYSLRVRVRNKGNAAAKGVTLGLAAALISASGQVKPGLTALGTIKIPSIAANAEAIGSTAIQVPKLKDDPKWPPLVRPKLTGRLRITATIVSAADTSADNNTAFREFALASP